MKNIKLFLLLSALILSGCQNSITKLFPKEPRPFQAKEFNSEQWKNGDYQTRGEMAENLREIVDDYKNPWKKSADEVRQILGEPDVITQADCCEIGRGVSPQKVELWLYYIEIDEDYLRIQKKDESNKKIIPQAFKLYFRKGEPQTFETVIGDRDKDHSVRMPVVGMVKF